MNNLSSEIVTKNFALNNLSKFMDMCMYMCFRLSFQKVGRM